MIVAVASPLETKISLSAASYTTASTPAPIGRVVITFPLLISTTLRPLLVRQPVNNLPLAASNASPVGPPQGARGQVAFTVQFFVSMTFRQFRSSILLYTMPFPSLTANSGPPSRSTVLTSFS